MMYESKYIVKEHDAGFLISGRPHPLDRPDQPEWLVDLAYSYSGGKRPKVGVICSPHYFEVVSDDEEACGSGGIVTLCDFYGLLRAVSTTLMSRWLAVSEKADEPRVPRAVCEWAPRRTAWAICTRVHDQWKRHLRKVDPTVLAVNKAVFSATFGYGPAQPLVDERLYQDRYIVQDILHYRAAAIAVRLCDWLWRNYDPVEKLRDWRSLYVPEGFKPYTSLNKTLTNLPGGVPLKVLRQLRRVVLPRPIYSRLELLATLSATDGLADNFNVVAFASADKIRKAMERVSRYWYTPLSPRRWCDVETAVRYMLDFPEHHRGNIVGLAHKSIRWHRDNRREAARRAVEDLGELRQLAKPPVDPPEEDGIRLLGTVGDLVEEGNQMGNCISGYAQRAVNGWCYLFHVDHNGEAASVEVDRWGCVRQSYGPGNTPNLAAEWGRAQLGKWGRTFPKETEAASQSTDNISAE